MLPRLSLTVRRLVLRAFASPSLEVALLRAEQAEGETRELSRRVQALHVLAALEEDRAGVLEIERDDARAFASATLDREQAALARVRELEASAGPLADAALDALTNEATTGGACALLAAELQADQHDFEIIRHNADRRAEMWRRRSARIGRAWGVAVKSRDAYERALKAEEGKTAVLRAEIASLRRPVAMGAE